MVEQAVVNKPSVLSGMVYPGRVLALGRSLCGMHNVIVYGLTGRSPSSQARMLERTEDGGLRTQVTDLQLLETGNPSLLLYDSVRRFQDMFLVSNGSQTDLLQETAEVLWATGQRAQPLGILAEAVARPHWVQGNDRDDHIDLTMFEPDAPNYTPRISGVLGQDSAALSIVRHTMSPDGVTVLPVRSLFAVPLLAGQGAMLSTYAGPNVPGGTALPSFSGEPLALSFYQESPEAMARAFYNELGPDANAQSDAPDFRVSLAVMWIHRQTYRVQSHIVNRKELNG